MEKRAYHSKECRVWEEKVKIPTYETGKADHNPMFLERRVYQGSSGKVYPYPVIEKITDHKVLKEYTAVFLENEYIKVMVLPELGGRIQRALDKTNGYDFVYYNEVIKPALVGLTGPWISGGIEFNWPQHHRPTTFAPLDYRIIDELDRKSVECSEVDQIHGTKGKMRISIYPDRAFIEISAQLYNRTSLPQTFLWWANPAVAVNDHTQSVFPPDVHAVYDHGKRDVSKFPIATGTYYKHNYGAGVDISRYKNIPVPTSYMCAHSDYDFVGGYDYGADAGILHVCDHHVSPGKKQWTWGCGDFGRAWDRNLTDHNGPYIELMTGVYTDNQPDFSWLKPFEEKTFTQYFLPYRGVGYVKNANKNIVLNLQTSGEKAEIAVYATTEYKEAKVVLTQNEKKIYENVCTLSPTQVLKDTVKFTGDSLGLKLSVYNQGGKKLLSWQPQKANMEKIPDANKAPGAPEGIQTTEELYLIGRHLEQYRHATWSPDAYYLEGLKRDDKDSRLNTAYGFLLLGRGCFAECVPYFKKALTRLQAYNPNPYNSEAFYGLGLALFYQERYDEAFDAFYKATWSAGQQETGYYYLAVIAAARREFLQALEFIEKSLVRNIHNLKARALKGMLLVRLGREKEAVKWLTENMQVDAFDYNSALLLEKLQHNSQEKTLALMQDRVSTFLECALDLGEAGFFQEAISLLRSCKKKSPLLKYYEAYYTEKRMQQETQSEAVAQLLREAEARNPQYCFPNRLEEIKILQFVTKKNPSGGMAPYYLGCLWYDRQQYNKAVQQWKMSSSRNPEFPTVWRNLALASYEHTGEADLALQYMEKAFLLDSSDARILMELTQLYHRMGRSVQQILDFLYAHRELALSRDDLYVEYVTLLNLTGEYSRALEMLSDHRFHPWEGGEGKVTTQYTTALIQLARKAMQEDDVSQAKKFLMQALHFPENLGEGRLEGEKDNHIYYELGVCEEKLGDIQAAQKNFERALAGMEELSGMQYYNDQPADMLLYEGLAYRKLDRENKARECFHRLLTYGEKHYYDEVKIDYFAVSLPDLQLFHKDLNLQNRIHCVYLIGLGNLGLHRLNEAKEALNRVLEAEPSHMGAVIHRQLLSQLV